MIHPLNIKNINPLNPQETLNLLKFAQAQLAQTIVENLVYQFGTEGDESNQLKGKDIINDIIRDKVKHKWDKDGAKITETLQFNGEKIFITIKKQHDNTHKVELAFEEESKITIGGFYFSVEGESNNIKIKNNETDDRNNPKIYNPINNRTLRIAQALAIYNYAVKSHLESTPTPTTTTTATSYLPSLANLGPSSGKTTVEVYIALMLKRGILVVPNSGLKNDVMSDLKAANSDRGMNTNLTLSEELYKEPNVTETADILCLTFEELQEIYIRYLLSKKITELSEKEKMDLTKYQENPKKYTKKQELSRLNEDEMNWFENNVIFMDEAHEANPEYNPNLLPGFRDFCASRKETLFLTGTPDKKIIDSSREIASFTVNDALKGHLYRDYNDFILSSEKNPLIALLAERDSRIQLLEPGDNGYSTEHPVLQEAALLRSFLYISDEATREKAVQLLNGISSEELNELNTMYEQQLMESYDTLIRLKETWIKKRINQTIENELIKLISAEYKKTSINAKMPPIELLDSNGILKSDRSIYKEWLKTIPSEFKDIADIEQLNFQKFYNTIVRDRIAPSVSEMKTAQNYTFLKEPLKECVKQCPFASLNPIDHTIKSPAECVKAWVAKNSKISKTLRFLSSDFPDIRKSLEEEKTNLGKELESFKQERVNLDKIPPTAKKEVKDNAQERIKDLEKILLAVKLDLEEITKLLQIQDKSILALEFFKKSISIRVTNKSLLQKIKNEKILKRMRAHITALALTFIFDNNFSNGNNNDKDFLYLNDLLSEENNPIQFSKKTPVCDPTEIKRRISAMQTKLISEGGLNEEHATAYSSIVQQEIFRLLDGELSNQISRYNATKESNTNECERIKRELETSNEQLDKLNRKIEAIEKETSEIKQKNRNLKFKLAKTQPSENESDLTNAIKKEIADNDFKIKENDSKSESIGLQTLQSQENIDNLNEELKKAETKKNEVEKELKKETFTLSAGDIICPTLRLENLESIGYENASIADGKNQVLDKEKIVKSQYGLIRTLILSEKYVAGISQKSLMQTGFLLSSIDDPLNDARRIFQLAARLHRDTGYRGMNISAATKSVGAHITTRDAQTKAASKILSGASPQGYADIDRRKNKKILEKLESINNHLKKINDTSDIDDLTQNRYAMIIAEQMIILETLDATTMIKKPTGDTETKINKLRVENENIMRLKKNSAFMKKITDAKPALNREAIERKYLQKISVDLLLDSDYVSDMIKESEEIINLINTAETAEYNNYDIATKILRMLCNQSRAASIINSATSTINTTQQSSARSVSDTLTSLFSTPRGSSTQPPTLSLKTQARIYDLQSQINKIDKNVLTISSLLHAKKTTSEKTLFELVSEQRDTLLSESTNVTEEEKAAINQFFIMKDSCLRSQRKRHSLEITEPTSTATIPAATIPSAATPPAIVHSNQKPPASGETMVQGTVASVSMQKAPTA